MRIHSKPPKKEVNLLGESFINSKKTNQLRFKAALIDLQERDGFNWWRQFQDNHRVEKNLDKIPFVVITLAIDLLGYKHPKPKTKSELV